jgi:hypothetical protein
MSITAQRANEFNIKPQQHDESEQAFRQRVSSTLRDMGYVIEAHEAFADKLYDEGNTMDGIIGYVAQAMQGVSYSGDKIGNDIAAGVVAKKPKRDDTADALLLMMAMLGR